jgi:hypothetical protein
MRFRLAGQSRQQAAALDPARLDTPGELVTRHLRIVPDEQELGPYEVTATPDWPPVAIPGRPGWWRHCIDGQQVDLPTNNPQN